jgi:putative ABC transport system ATP-binding protein
MDSVLVWGRGLARAYGRGERRRTVLHDVDVCVRAGDRVAVTGPSGSGKTTLLHLLAGLIEPTSGVIEWPGLEQPLRPERIGVAFQGDTLLPALTVRENVAVPALVAGRSEADAARASAEMLEAFGLTDVAGHLPERISGGQAQRATIARALVVRPQLVLLDEPTAQLDRPTGLRAVETAIATAADCGGAIVVATHDPMVARLMRERVELRSPRREEASSRSA